MSGARGLCHLPWMMTARGCRPSLRRVVAAGSAAATVLTLTACGGGGETEVRAAAKEFFTLAAAGGPDACKLAGPKYQGSADGCLSDAQSLGDPDVLEPVDAVNEVTVDGDRATARIVSAGSRLPGALLMVKTDDGWRFDGVNTSVL